MTRACRTVDYSKPRDARVSLLWFILLLSAAVLLHLLLGLLFKPREYVPAERLRAKRVNVILPPSAYINANKQFSLTYFDPCIFLKTDDTFGFGFFRRMGEDPRLTPIPFTLPELPPALSGTEKILEEEPVPLRQGLYPRPLHLSDDIAASALDNAAASSVVQQKTPQYPQIRIADENFPGSLLNTTISEKDAPSGMTVLRVLKPVLPDLPMETEITRSCGSEELDLIAMRNINLLLAGGKLPYPQKDGSIRILWKEPAGVSQFQCPQELEEEPQQVRQTNEKERSSGQ